MADSGGNTQREVFRRQQTKKTDKSTAVMAMPPIQTKKQTIKDIQDRFGKDSNTKESWTVQSPIKVKDLAGSMPARSNPVKMEKCTVASGPHTAVTTITTVSHIVL
ncbi:hypothetical protein J6590_034995 [Homalodisca vitripennis]|nr:hypothetical protein J6590_034995 [Homalodisca vitripennis]